MRYFIFILICIFMNPTFSSASESLIVKKAEKEIRLFGYTRHRKAVTVSSEISGKVLKVNYDVGDTIGDRSFIEIDPTFVDLEIERTEQSVQKVDVALEKAESRIAYLEKEFVRRDRLHKGDRETEVRRDEALQKFEQAKLELDSVASEKAILTTRLKELRERKNRHSIFAPRGWVVTERNVDKGEVVQQGVPLAEVADYRTLVVPLSVSGEELSAIQSFPKSFHATLDGQPVTASLNWVNPEFDEKTRKLKIELLVKKYSGERRGGLKLVIPVSIRTEGIYVPEAAVVNRYENPTVTLKKTGEVVKLLIIGKAGDYLITAEDERLFPGTELVPAINSRKAEKR